MSLIRKHVAVLQAWACLDLVLVLLFIRIRLDGFASLKLQCYRHYGV